MKTLYLDTSPKIPEESPVTTLEKNAWIAPNGDFYGFRGGHHERAAMYIAIFKLGADDKTLKRGTYFNEMWEDWLLKQGWVCIKNLSWLGEPSSSTFQCSDWTEKQKSAVFDYCEAFGYDYEKVFLGKP